jgi:2-hydroxychromene-2-carboxylate isomerase
MTTEIRFLFDYVSPYAYLASTRIRDVARRHACTVVPVPVLFGAMLESTHSRGPAEVAVKRAYLHRDILRLARMFAVPMAPPATHPFNPLVPLRMTAAIADVAQRFAFVDAVFRAAWVDSRRVDEASVAVHVADDVGLDGRALFEQASAAETKAVLRKNTEDAIAKGAFGVPTILADGELFWGVDSLPLLDRFLEGERIAAEELERWARIVPSANRK